LGFGLWGDVCNFEECLPSLGCHCNFDQGCSAPFFCALTVNVIGHLFLRQCSILLLPSTATSISGMSRKFSIWTLVSQYVYWRMAGRDVKSCCCDWRVEPGDRINGADVMLKW
jgi:hypothetical protein